MSVADQPTGIASTDEITLEELQLAARNHGMPLEALRYDVTPLGMHYLLTHFDVPEADESTWTVAIDGRVAEPIALTMADIRARPAVTQQVTMECAGNGRARLHPRPLSQPWLNEAVGNSEWTGTPLAPILADAELADDAVEIVFQGADHGIQGGIEQDYERSLSIAEATAEGVLLAYAVNGQPLPPQHGFPIRLLVPGWYGMTSVKWLRRITAVSERFDGFQMWAYRLRQREDEPGVAVTRIQPRALMIPPGFPEFFSRTRTVDAGATILQGRAWSGLAPIRRVDVTTDGGATWTEAELGPEPSSPHAWIAWTFEWDAAPGDYELAAKATDAAGGAQPVDEPWNHHGLGNNSPQRVRVVVRAEPTR
ncbi:MAG: sulfite oxidase [Actinomycetota bacterium]|nr:sulfite oxidase [Actinomycetota bacterium]